MPAKINLINQRFGKLLVIEETNKRKQNAVVWKCQCDCGNIVEYSSRELRSDGIISCPNCGSKRNPQSNITPDIINQKFGHLTVLEKTKQKKADGKLLYKCQCDCENQTIIYTTRTSLISGETTSCGCRKRKYKIGDIVNNRKIIGLIGSKDNSSRHYYYQCKCLLCGREYESLGQSLENSISCGCQRSIGEYYILKILQENKIKYKKEFCFPNSLLRFDFAIFDETNNNIIRLIEFDGEQHYLEGVKNKGWNTYEKYEQTYQNDQKKNILAKESNIPLVRIPYWERENITFDLLFSDKYLIK